LQLCTFVWQRTFGSNLQGMHGGGAARVAVSKFGVIMGQGVGIQG
jgi:ADP-ribosylglycohydrolase